MAAPGPCLRLCTGTGTGGFIPWVLREPGCAPGKGGGDSSRGHLLPAEGDRSQPLCRAPGAHRCSPAGTPAASSVSADGCLSNTEKQEIFAARALRNTPSESSSGYKMHQRFQCFPGTFRAASRAGLALHEEGGRASGQRRCSPRVLGARGSLSSVPLGCCEHGAAPRSQQQQLMQTQGCTACKPRHAFQYLYNTVLL